MRAALRTEATKILRRPALWWAVAVTVVMSVLFGYLIPYLVRDGAVGGPGGGEQGFSAIPITLLYPEQLVDNQIGAFPLFYLALALVLGALSSGSEYTWRTIRSLLVRGPGRATLLGAKTLALLSVVVLIALAAFAAGAVAALVVALVEDGPLTPPPVGELLGGIAAAWLILAVGSLLGLLGGVLARGTGPVIGAGLVYLFVVELLFRSFAPQSVVIEGIAKALPGSNAGSLAGAITGSAQGAPGVNRLVDGTQAILVLALWGMAAGVAAFVVFTRRDVTT